MKTTFSSLFKLTTLVMLLIFNASVYATPDGINKQQAVSIAQQSYPGRVLSVKQKGDEYHVKTLNDSGEVRVIIIDANSGKIISGS